MVQTIQQNHTNSETTFVANTYTSDTSSITESLNITTNQTTQLEILKLLRELQLNIQGTNTEGSGDSAGRGAGGLRNRNDNGGRRNRGIRRNKKTPDNASFPLPQKDKYCWTHGACNHNSKDCN